MKIIFTNPPWWERGEERETDKNARTQDSGVSGSRVLPLSRSSPLRYGIRAGSRWPFTAPAHCAPDNFIFGGYLPFPFFMGYAASYVQRAFPGATVTLRDSIAMRESYQGWLQFLQHTEPDWIILESATPSWEHDQQCIRLIAKHCPQASIVVCGSIAQSHWQDALALHGNVRAVIQGEYEKPLVRVIRGDVSGLQPHDLLTKEEMNRAPFPLIPKETAHHYWDGCPVDRAVGPGQDQRPGRFPQLQVWSSRGCPYKCCFCVWPASMTGNDPDGTKARSVRLYSPEYMAAFLAEAIATHGYRSIYDDSDTFNLVERHTIAMCEVYRKTGLPWSAMCRADTINRDTWKLMEQSGCFGVKIGFESGSQRVVDEIVNKKLNLAEAADTARYIRSLGMSCHGTFTVGLPGETPDEAQQTVKFIEELYRTGGLDTHQLSGTAEIEGTPLATLRQVGHLPSYPGAVMDEHYHRDSDGQHKIEQMKNART
jgi:radical SAM superfamily enzyme YgiQ (UPF0313 family)